LNLEEGVSPDQIRRQAIAGTGQAKRTWKVSRQPGAPPLPKLAWSLTIADVAAGGRDGSFPDAARYRELVTRWARVTLQ